MSPSRWSRKTWNRITLAAGGLLGVLSVTFWLPSRVVRALNPADWALSQWVATALLILIGFGLVGLYGHIAAQRSDLDTAWDEIERLRGEVVKQGESVHQLALAASGRPSTAIMPGTLTPQTIQADFVVEPGTGPIFMDDAPTTVTGLRSARPAVPPGRLDVRHDVEEDRPAGRHAAAD